jgi:hypothetical protein
VVQRGTYARGQVQVRQRSPSGQFSRANTSFAAFTVDTVAVVPRLALVEDTGRSRRDRITSNGSVSVSRLEEGATWQFSLDGGNSWRNGSGTTFLVPLGTYSAGQVQVRQRDLAGNLSAAQTSFAALTVDTQAAAPVLALEADTGRSASDRITNNSTLTVLGLEDGAAWEFSLDAGTTWRRGSGSRLSLADDSYEAGQVQVRQTDLAGNISAANTTFAAFTIDTVAAPPQLELTEDTGSSQSDRISRNPTIQVSGLEEGASWQYSLNGGNTWINGRGTGFVVPDGTYPKGRVQVRQTDRAGNSSPANTSFAAFTIDTVAEAPVLELAADTGSSASDRITSNPTIQVLALEEGASWEYSLNGGSSWITGSGSSVVLADGIYGDGQVQVRQTDRAGNTSPANTSFAAFTIDTVAEAPVLELAADTGNSASDRITNNRTINVSGLEAGASWQYSLNGGSSWTSGSGSSFDLADGSYGAGQVQVRQTDRAGNSSPANTSFAAFMVDTTAPAAPALALAQDTDIPNDRITSNGTIQVSGLESGASWQYSLNSGDSWINGSGSSFQVAAGTYTNGQVQVRQRDVAGNLSAANTGFPAFSVTLPNLSIAPLDADKLEGNSGTTPFTFRVTRSGDSTVSSSVAWSVTGTGVNPANALDFVGDAFPSGIVTFAAGETTKTITVQVVGDTLFGPDETFAVTLANPTNAAIANATAIGVIRNDDLSIQEPVLVRESILPDGALGAVAGKGWTATGLVHDPVDDVFWVANHGQAKKTTVNQTPSIIKMNKDATAILAQIDVKSLYPDNTTIQGLTLDTANQSLWFAASQQDKIRNITKNGARIRELSFNGPNGLAYDPKEDRLIVLHPPQPGASLNRISVLNKTTGAVVRSYSTGTTPGDDWVYGADMLYFDPATRYLYMSYGADPQPGSIRVFDHDAGRQIGTIGALSRVTATEGVSIIGSTIYMVSDDYFSTNTPNRFLTLRHVKVASSEGRDVVTGTSASDIFSWDSLADTSLVNYDTVVNFARDDKISISGLSYGQILSSSVGNISSLAYANLISLLNNTRLPANRAAAFTVTGMNGTFIALNDRRAAFQSDTDGLVFLKGYTMGSANTITIV